MPEYFTEGNIPKASDTPTRSLQKITDLLLNPRLPGFGVPAYDHIDLTYWTTTNNLHTVVYKKLGVTVATVTLTYDDPGVDDANLLTAVKS